MGKKYYILLSLIVFSIRLSAQNFEGTVIDENKRPIEFANVALYSLPDSVLVTGTITNGNGKFSFDNIEVSDAFLRVSFIGYETQNIPVNQGDTIILKSESTLLGEVLIKGNLPKIQIKNDALVTMVENSILSKAGTGNDVLKRLPSLSGDNGIFSVFGKGEAKIYINNREMRDASELDNLNSADIRDVEIVNNPGARYDASIKAIIRINTLRKIGDGISFDVRSSYFQSENTDLTEQINVNYRNKNLDIFGTLKFERNAFVQDSKLWQKTYVDTLWAQNNTLYMDGISNTLTGIAGMNYEISPKHFIGMKYNLSIFPKNEVLSEMNSIVQADGNFYDKWNSKENKISNDAPTRRLSAYYNGNFDKLKADFNTDYYTSKKESNSYVNETSQEYNNQSLHTVNNVKNRLFASKLVLSYPVLGGQISFGNEYTNTNREDKYRNDEGIIAASNISINEQNSAFFAEYSRNSSLGQMGLGIRYENVVSDYFNNNNKVQEQSRKYDQWFPNISLSKQLKNVQLQLSYTTKTKRPTYRQLSSNIFYANRFTLQTGNPYLKPSIIHDLTLVSSWKIAQATVSYKNEQDAIIYWMEQMESNSAISILSYRNLRKLPSFTAFLSFSPTFGIWTPQLSGGIIKQWLTIISNNITVKLNKPMFMVSLNNSFNLSNGLLVTLDNDFKSKGHYQNVYLSENRLVVNIGLNKSFLNDCLNIELKGHDLFKAKDGNLVYNPQIELYQLNQYDSREIELTIRYKFNSANSKYKGKGVGQSEINRF
jgi:hypothetical protein